MPEDTGQDQTPAPEAVEGQPETSPDMIQVGDRQMTRDDLVKSYQNAHSELTKKSQENATLQTQLKGYSWADAFQDRYSSQSDFRRGFDDLLEGQGQQPIQELNPQYQEIQSLKQEQALVRMERDFDKLRQEGYELDKNMETEILKEMAQNRFADADSAYKTMFFDKALSQAREQATSQTAEQLSENQSAYSQPAKGITAKPAKVDVASMDQTQKDAYLQKRINEMDMFNE